jgi:anion-transporting  ArsA/GET3 family ATPase
MKAEHWLQREVLVTVGTGGVGKTTVAAALGLEAARRGRRVLVMTIDPARRLADALGIGELDHEPRAVPPDALGPAGAEGDGELHAMMLDTKRTFDELIESLSPDPELYERLRDNVIYKNLTDALAGSREYSAMEKLSQLHARAEWDLIVVDTPPASHALDFLDAPRRMTAFLDSTLLRALLQPALRAGRLGMRMLRSSSELVLGILQRITGLEFLSALSEFVIAFESLLGGLHARADAVGALLRSERCGFVLVAGPEPQQVERARGFWARLQQERVDLVGAVINRVRSWPGQRVPDVERERAPAREWLTRYLSDADTDLLLDAAERRAFLSQRDAARCDALVAALEISPSLARRVPLLDEDVHAIDALQQIAREIFRD